MNSPLDADYEYQFFDRLACAGSPFKEPTELNERYLDWKSWMGDTRYWAFVRGRFGDGTDLLADMEGWSISIIDKADGTEKQCCNIIGVTVYEHLARLLEDTASNYEQN